MSAFDRTAYLDTNTIQGPSHNVRAVHIPANGSQIGFVKIDLVCVKDETGVCPPSYPQALQPTTHMKVSKCPPAALYIELSSIPTLYKPQLLTLTWQKTRLFPDGRLFWGDQAMSVANAFVVSLANKQPASLNGDYYVFKTDGVGGLPKNAHLARRSRGAYGDALILKSGGVGPVGPRFVSLHPISMRSDTLGELLYEINAL